MKYNTEFMTLRLESVSNTCTSVAYSVEARQQV